MTDSDIDAALALATVAKKRANAATPGPWEISDQERDAVIAPNHPRLPWLIARTVDGVGVPPEDDWVSNTVFVAVARSDVPALADAVLHLADELRAVQAILGDACKESAMYEKGVRDALAAVERERNHYHEILGPCSEVGALVEAMDTVRALLPS